MEKYSEILADVRRLFRRIKKEYEIARKIDKGNQKLINQYKLEIHKIKRLTNTKRPFSLGKGKKKNDLIEIRDELEIFLNEPNITEKDREKRKKEKFETFIHNWQLTEHQANNFFNIVNSDEMQELIEMKMFDSDQILEISRDIENVKKAVHKLANLTNKKRNELENKPISERVEWLEKYLKGVIK